MKNSNLLFAAALLLLTGCQLGVSRDQTTGQTAATASVNLSIHDFKSIIRTVKKGVFSAAVITQGISEDRSK